MPTSADRVSNIVVQIIARNRLMRSGLRLFVENWPGLTVASEAESVGDACAMQRVPAPDVIVIDLDDDSILHLAMLRSTYLASRVVLLTHQQQPADARLKNASGLFCRHQAEHFLGPAIQAVHRGECWPHAGICHGLVCKVTTKDS